MPRKNTKTKTWGAKKPVAARAMVEELTTKELVTNKHGRPVMFYEIALEINEAIQKSYRPHLRDEQCFFERLWGDLQKKHGDYICKSILYICEILRAKDPTLFDKTTPTDIAKTIIDNFPQSNMLEQLKIVDVGFITFKLNGKWMAERICSNLKAGITAWAPLLSMERAIVGSPVQASTAKKLADVRLGFVRDTLVRMLEYSGVHVSDTMRNREALQKVKKYLSEENGIIRTKGVKGKKGKQDPLFSIKEEASHKGQPNNVYEDLSALWCGIYEQNADWIVYVTPVQQRDYIFACFKAAKEFKNDVSATMSYLGVKDFGAEKRNLRSLFELYRSYTHATSDKYGYSPEALCECTVRYEYLRKVTYSDCTFEKDHTDMFKPQGNTFLSILTTKALIRKVLLEHSNTTLESKKALVGIERELGLDLLRFTEIVEESIRGTSPSWLCEYVYNLAEKLMTYMPENVEQLGELSEMGVLILKAAEVVMQQSFHLLGLTLESLRGEQWYWKGQSDEHMAIRDLYISCPVSVSRPRLASRFEVFTMYVEVNHPNFKNGRLFGNISASDTFGLRPETWCEVDSKGCGHVALFDQDWHDGIGIKDTSFLSFGDPASRHSVAFSTSIDIGLRLWVTSKKGKDNKKEACYQLCYATEPIRLKGFWDGDRGVERSAFEAVGANGSVSMYYILLKEGVDTAIRLEYQPTHADVQVRGYVLAYYGGDVLEDCVHDLDKKSYKAEIFSIEPPNVLPRGGLALKKSALAVPKKGVLVFEAYFKHVESGDIVEGRHKFREEEEGLKSEWIIDGRFTLKVDWIRDN